MLGGFTVTKDQNEWLHGYESDIFKKFTEGDFFTGADKDLDNKITPVFNYDKDFIKNTLMKMNTGALDIDKVARIVQVNDEPYLNIQKNIYNGSGPVF